MLQRLAPVMKEDPRIARVSPATLLYYVRLEDSQRKDSQRQKTASVKRQPGNQILLLRRLKRDTSFPDRRQEVTQPVLGNADAVKGPW
jgi:hypothetical protein